MAISQFSICRSRNTGQVMPIKSSICIDDFVFKKVAWQLFNFQFVNMSIKSSFSIDDFGIKKVVSIIDLLKIEQLAH